MASIMKASMKPASLLVPSLGFPAIVAPANSKLSLVKLKRNGRWVAAEQKRDKHLRKPRQQQ